MCKCICIYTYMHALKMKVCTEFVVQFQKTCTPISFILSKNENIICHPLIF